MGIRDWFGNRFSNKASNVTRIELVSDKGAGFYAWDGKLYQSDIVRSAIRPYSRAIGKLVPQHVRNDKNGLKVNPEPYIRMLLEEPNPHMTFQVMLEKMATTVRLNSNAFAIIVRDEFGLPSEIYPIPAKIVESFLEKGLMYYRFYLKNGKKLTALHSDVIHWRRDFYSNDVFGDHPGKAMEQIMEVITTIDQGYVNAIKNSAVIKWILKTTGVSKASNLKKELDQFVSDYLSIENSGGAIVADDKFDVQQVKQDNVVPNADQMKGQVIRVFNFFNTNEKIIRSDFSEDDWNAYYEAEIEPDAMQLSGEFTRKLFKRKERSYGNKIIFAGNNLQYASMKTKLELLQMVDRGALSPNEWRAVMNLGPVEGGDQIIRRLDTAVVTNSINHAMERGEKNDKTSA